MEADAGGWRAGLPCCKRENACTANSFEADAAGSWGQAPLERRAEIESGDKKGSASFSYTLK